MALTKVTYSMIDGDVANVVDYGASPTASATVNAAAFNAALSAGFSGVYIPAGTYEVNATLAVSSNTTIFSDGFATVHQVADNTTTFLLDGCSDVIINGITVEGKGVTDTGSVVINDATAKSFGIHVTDSSNVWIQNCSVLQCKRIGILTDTSNNVWIQNNIVVGCGPDPDVPNGDTNVFTGGIVIDAAGVATISYRNINVIGNRVSFFHDCLFAAQGYGNITIQGNYFSNASNHTAYCYPGVDWLIEGNFFDAPFNDAFKFQWYADGSSSGDYIPANLTLSNNNFTNVPVGNWCINAFVIDVVVSTPIKFRKEFRNVNITNNVMRTSGRGINLSSTIGGVIIGNTLIGNQVGIRTTDFAGLISNNYIFAAAVNPLVSLAHWRYVTYINDNIIEGGGQTTPITAYIEAYNFQGFSPWEPNDIYTFDDVVSNGLNVYICTQQGVSASSGGPTGTGTGIADGTVLWNYAGTVASYGGGRISIQGNKVNYIDGTQVTYALYSNDSSLVLDSKDNVFPLTQADGTTASTYRSEATMVTLKDNIHGGYFGGTFPTITTTTTGKPFRDFMQSAAPVAGTWARGDRVWNTAPSAGGVLMWVCTTAGTPGTWKAVAIAA
jgi:parallel beta-helix repeat protein